MVVGELAGATQFRPSYLGEARPNCSLNKPRSFSLSATIAMFAPSGLTSQ